MATTRVKSSKSTKKTAGAPSPTRRRVAVLVSLVAVLTLTSALLHALAPAPLNLQASSSLFAMDAPQSMDELFGSTTVPVSAGRWHYIYIHHSDTLGGSARSLADSATGLADHFVIGNGDGCGDGEIDISQRWTQQLAAGVTPGANYINTDCISICLVGDFNQSRPTPTQQRRLVQLVGALQARLQIPRGRIFLYNNISNAAGVGRYFPTQDFISQALP